MHNTVKNLLDINNNIKNYLDKLKISKKPKIIDRNLILKIKKYCKKKLIKFFLSNNVKLAIQLDLDGAYIPSFNKSLSHLAYKYKKNFR